MGVRIPSTVMKEVHWMPGEELEIKADDKGRITLTPVKNQQEGWLEKFNAVADSERESSHLDIANDYD